MASKWGAAASGAAGGAVAGGATFGPPGAIIGGLLGGIGGLFSGGAAEDAADAQRKAMAEAMGQLQQYSQQSYQRRMQDLQHTLGFYNPADNYLRSIYGGPPAQRPGTPLPLGHGWQTGDALTRAGGISSVPATPSLMPQPGQMPPLPPMSRFGR